MENNETISFCEQVRSIYGDTQHEFAVRLGVAIDTIKRWEKKNDLGKTVGHALLMAAQKGTFPAMPPIFSKETESMSQQQIISSLLRGFGDNTYRFARRIGVNYSTITNWQNGVFKLSSAAKRLLRHVMEHPEDFIETPPARARVNEV